MEFRKATDEDAQNIQNLIFRILIEYGLKPEPEGTDADLKKPASYYEKSGGFFEVLMDDEQTIIGTLGLVRLNDTTCELRKMYLSRDYRGRGLGKKLLQRVFERAKDLGFQRIELETATVLKEALGLYVKNGFVPFQKSGGTCRCDLAFGKPL